MEIKKLNFTIESYEFKDIGSDLAEITLRVCHDNKNKNGSFLQLKNMIKAQNTIYGKPLLYSIDDKSKDFEEHEETGKLRACGYISEYSRDIRYEEKDGKMYLVVTAIVWKVYMPEVVEIFKRDGNKGISMEIKASKTNMRKDGYVDILDYIYLSVVLLGDKYETGMFNTTATLNFTKDELDVMIKESEKILKYRLEKNKIKEEEHMDFDRNEHAEKFKMTAKDVMSAMRESVFAEGDYWVEDYCADFVYVYSFEDNKIYGVPYKMENSKCTVDFGNKKNMKLTYVDVQENEEVAPLNFIEEIKNKNTQEINSKVEEFEVEKTEFAKQLEELQANKDELNSTIETKDNEIKEKENVVFSLNEKVKELEESVSNKDSEIETLSKFKLEKEKEERAEKVIELFSKLGTALTKSEMDEWKTKEVGYEKFEEFERDVKSFAYDKIADRTIDNKQAFSKMQVNIDEKDEPKEKSHDDVWDKFEKKVNN